MDLGIFISNNIETIINEWESFAKKIFPPKQTVSHSELRDHAKEMILSISNALKSHSSESACEHELGLNNSSQQNPKKNMAFLHGSHRLKQGFSIDELAAEFYSLRRIVMTLYLHDNPKKNAILTQVMLFNKLIDTALCDAIFMYSQEKEQKIRMFDTMLSGIPDYCHTLNLKGEIIYINKAMEKLYKEPTYQILGTSYYCFVMPTVKELNAYIQNIIKTGETYHGEKITKDSSKNMTRSFEFAYSPIFDKNEIIAIAGIIRDITKQKEKEQEIWYYANYDTLTGIANRRHFLDKLEATIKHMKRTNIGFSLFYVDLDKFKTINDHLSHAAGDALLIEIVNRMSAAIREIDLIGRLGGDEFGIILTGTSNIKDIKMIAEKLLSEIKKPFHFKKNIIHPLASVGIVIAPIDGCIADVLLKKADDAMYISKKSQIKKYTFHSPYAT